QINNCPLPSRIFHGRQAILNKMHEFFNKGIGKQDIYVLHGLGGAGKTQIGLKFINDSSHHLNDHVFSFTDKFFLDGSTVETIDTGLKNIASMKNVGNSSQDALQWLAKNREDWLLFYDNTDDPKLNLNSFLPQCTHGNIIITTRNPGLCVYAGANSAVSDMAEGDGLALLLKSAAQDITPVNERMAAEIVKELCYLPLAIVQAGAFISQSGTLNSYLDIYRKNRAQLLSEKPAQSHDNYARTVYTTWQMSFDCLSPPAAMFLQLCSFLHWDGITRRFSAGLQHTHFIFWSIQRSTAKTTGVPCTFLEPAGEWDTLHFLKVTNEIKAYSLLTFDPREKCFQFIH
ncbi:P-loop containing nucleoside triphosphate hydrolase protein, partial [Mycena leptocephala]